MTSPDAVLAAAFPFHVVVGADLRIRRFGASMQKLLPNLQADAEFNESFQLITPTRGAATVPKVRRAIGHRVAIATRGLACRLVGQIVESNGEFYVLVTPQIHTSADLDHLGLRVADFALTEPILATSQPTASTDGAFDLHEISKYHAAMLALSEATARCDTVEAVAAVALDEIMNAFLFDRAEYWTPDGTGWRPSIERGPPSAVPEDARREAVQSAADDDWPWHVLEPEGWSAGTVVLRVNGVALGVLMFLGSDHPGMSRPLMDTLDAAAERLAWTHERWRSDEALRRAMADAQAASRAKSAFLASMSHELRTPLNAVLGAASLLMQTDLGAEQRQFVDVLRSSGDALLAIINDVLDLSKIEAGQMEVEVVPVNIRDVIEDVVDVLALRAEDAGLAFAAVVARDVPETLHTDALKIRQILMNLTGNALKFTRAGEVRLEVRFTRAAQGGTLVCEVHDTGIGIAPEALSRLFESFTQADSSMTRRFGGTGLGLSISRRLARLLDGDVTVTSEDGRGSCFTLAVHVPEAGPVPRAGERPRRTASVRHPHDATRRALVETLATFNIDAVDEGTTDVVFADVVDLGPTSIQVVGRKNRSPGSRQLAVPASRRSLLAALDASAATGARAGAAPAARGLWQRARVLLVDDNQVNVLIGSKMLKSLGITASVAENGRIACDACAREPFDLVFMDMQMPEMDGLEATRHLRETHGSQPWIIAMTANALSSDREACAEAGMNDFVSKPIRPEALLAALDRWATESPAAAALAG